MWTKQGTGLDIKQCGGDGNCKYSPLLQILPSNSANVCVCIYVRICR